MSDRTIWGFPNEVFRAGLPSVPSGRVVFGGIDGGIDHSAGLVYDPATSSLGVGGPPQATLTVYQGSNPYMVAFYGINSGFNEFKARYGAAPSPGDLIWENRVTSDPSDPVSNYVERVEQLGGAGDRRIKYMQGVAGNSSFGGYGFMLTSTTLEAKMIVLGDNVELYDPNVVSQATPYASHGIVTINGSSTSPLDVMCIDFSGVATHVWKKNGNVVFGGTDDQGFRLNVVGTGRATTGMLVSSSSATLAATAAMQVDSTTKGFLPPRMTTAQRNAIVAPAAGLIVYDTETNKSYTWNGSSWQAHW